VFRNIGRGKYTIKPLKTGLPNEASRNEGFSSKMQCCQRWTLSPLWPARSSEQGVSQEAEAGSNLTLAEQGIILPEEMAMQPNTPCLKQGLPMMSPLSLGKLLAGACTSQWPLAG
jgi:hypothetical protein